MTKFHEAVDVVNPFRVLAKAGNHRHPTRWLGSAAWFTLLQFGLGTGFFYVGRNVLDEEIPVDTLFAGLTLLLGLFVPVAMDRHRSLMEAYYSVAKTRNTLVRVLQTASEEKEDFKGELGKRVRDWVHSDDVPESAESLSKTWNSKEDYVQDAISQLYEAIYKLRTTKKWNVENTYPDLLAISLFLYFGVFFPLFQHQGQYDAFAVQLFFTAFFCNIIFTLARRDVLPFGTNSEEYITLKTLQLEPPATSLIPTISTTNTITPMTVSRTLPLKLHPF